MTSAPLARHFVRSVLATVVTVAVVACAGEEDVRAPASIGRPSRIRPSFGPQRPAPRSRPMSRPKPERFSPTNEKTDRDRPVKSLGLKMVGCVSSFVVRMIVAGPCHPARQSQACSRLMDRPPIGASITKFSPFRCLKACGPAKPKASRRPRSRQFAVAPNGSIIPRPSDSEVVANCRSMVAPCQ